MIDITVRPQYTRSRLRHRVAGPDCAEDSMRIDRGAGGSWNVVKNETPNRYAITPIATSPNRTGP